MDTVGTTAPRVHATANAAAACDFKGWHVTVWLRQPQCVMPPCCSCCLREDDLVEQLVKVRKGAAEIRFPICTSCRKHAKMDSIAMGVSLAVGALLPPVAYFVVGAPFVRRGFLLLGMLYLVAAVAVGAAVYWLLCTCIAGRTDACADTSWPVEAMADTTLNDLLGSKSERRDERAAREYATHVARQIGPGCVALVFRNKGYARWFIEINGGDPDAIHRIEEAM